VDPAGPRWRRVLSSVLVVLAPLLLAVALLTAYATQNLLDADRFAERAASALTQEDVRAAASERIAGAVVKAEPNLIGARPLVEGAASGIVGSPPFRQLFQGAVADLHRTVFESDRDTVALKVADAGVLVIEALRTLAPKVAAKVPKGLEARLVSLSKGGGSAFTEAARVADDVRWAGVASVILALLAAGGAIAASPDRRRTVGRLAAAAAAVGLLGIVAFEVGRALLGGAVDPEEAPAAEVVFDAFLVDLRTWFIVVAALGLIVAAASAGLLRTPDAGSWPTRAWSTIAATPATTSRRTARALALLAAGGAILLFPALAARLAVLAVGVVALYAGVAELLRLTLPAEPERAGRGRRSPGRWRRPAVAVLVGALVLAAVVGLASAGNDPETAPLDIRACNGSPELCDRTVDEVVFPGTHNSFSAADQPNWLFAQQERGIPAQLEAGVRALLIDTHYGVETERGVYTVLGKDSTSREKIEEPLGNRFVETAERLRSRIGYEGGGTREVFLCHAFCETGSVDAVRALRDVRDYLVRNPYEVLVVSVESDVGLEANAQVFADSGLLDMVWRKPLGADSFPTLREMIEADRRVIVLLWQRGPLEDAGFGDYPWMHRQFGLVRETAYEDNKTAKDLLATPASCRPNEGREDNPLFLLNHWVESSPLFLPSNARKVNAYDALLKRSRACARVRDALPNIIAVDFYEEGDVFRVARTLNGG
jgi:hypothetical protein